MAGIGLDQLRGDPNSPARFAHAALEDVPYAQLLPDLLDIDGLAPVDKGRIAGDHREGAPAGEHRNDILGYAVGKIFLLRIAAKIGEWQNRDGSPAVKSRRTCSDHSGRPGRVCTI